jgi:photosystem II stability/assembly factor-like uncharacterized protein
MWAAADSLRWLDENVPPGVWRAAQGIGGCFFVLPLGQDTLIVLRGNGYRSVDNGTSFTHVSPFGRDIAVEVPPGHVAASRLLMGTLQNATGAAFSDDRGATWIQATVNSPHALHRLYAFADVPAQDTPPGVVHRIVGGADGGVYISDDAGESWRPGPAPAFLYPDYRGDQVAALPRLGGGTRLILLVDVSGAPSIATFTSNDAGDSWTQGPWLSEPPGLGAPNADGLVHLGGSSALAVLGRGRIHRTDDAGLTWQEVAQTPRETDGVTVNHAALGPDGRLYVAMAVTGASPEGAWVYRTTDIVVAQEPPTVPPGQPTGATLEVVPNPSAGGSRMRLTLPADTETTITVHDAAGRQVVLLHAGPLAAGEHVFALPAGLPAGVYVARGAGVSVTFTVRPAGR